ncbi:MAG: hypothetical protein JXN65_05765 [Clostridia bacterium]|nr:hypothetical protein [Clostridia bacterium]
MSKYLKFIILIVALLIIFSGCSNSSFVNEKINMVLAQNNASDEAVEWLIYNKDLVAPVLVDRLSSSNKNKVSETKELLSLMGKDGITIVLSDYQSLSESGKAALADVLAEQMSKDAMLQLLAMSALDGGFDVSVAALINMGDSAAQFLETLLYQEKYYSCVNAVIAGNSQRVIDDIIPMVSNQSSYIQNRAMEIIALSDSSVISPFVQNVLNDTSLSNEKAIRISSTALNNNKDVAIDEIINMVALGNTNPVTSATMIYELSKESDLGTIFEKCAKSSNAVNTNDMLKELVRQAGVPRIVETAMNSNSTETITSISFALASYDFSTEAFIEVLNSLTESDTINSTIYTLASKLIYDPVFKGVAQSVIAMDAAALNNALQLEGANPKTIGDALSRTSENLTISQRIDTMLNAMDNISATRTMIVLAYGEDGVYPKLVWDRYAGPDAALSKSAMDVILEATSMGIKFKYTDMDFSPYAAKLVQDLNSHNSDTKNIALQILSKIPEGVEHHEFYQKVYEGYKDQSVFTVLCWHYVGEGAKKLNLSIAGTDTVIGEIAYEMKSVKVTNVDKSDFLDYEGMILQSINALGLKVTDTATTKLVITINEVPVSKQYRGMMGSSYLGAKCTTTIDIYISGEKVNTVSGYYEILPPVDNPAGENVYEYKNNPEDAPMETPFINSYIQALYKAFGEDVLYGTYQYDRLATLEVGSELWN